MCRKQALGNVGKSNEKEGDTEEKPRDGKDPDRRLETEEQVPNDRSSEEYRAEDIQLDVSLPVHTREQYNLITGCAQHLLSGQCHYNLECTTERQQTCPNAKMIPYSGQPKSSLDKKTCNLDGMTIVALSESPLTPIISISSSNDGAKTKFE